MEVEEGKWVVGYKNVMVNEDFFNGYFFEYFVMLGVLIVEVLVQVGVVVMLIKEENWGRFVFFVGIDNCCFKKQVKLGDKLEFEVDIICVCGMIGCGKGVVKVDGEFVCEVELIFVFGE